MHAQENADLLRDLPAVGLEGEMTRVVQVEVDIFKVFLVGMRASLGKDVVVLAVDDQRWWLTLAQDKMPAPNAMTTNRVVGLVLFMTRATPKLYDRQADRSGSQRSDRGNESEQCRDTGRPGAPQVSRKGRTEESQQEGRLQDPNRNVYRLGLVPSPAQPQDDKTTQGATNDAEPHSTFVPLRSNRNAKER